MPFKKGHKGYKPKGAVSEKTKAWEALGESIVDRHTERFNSLLDTVDDKDFLDRYLQVLEYFKPKLGRIDTSITVNEIPQITLKRGS